ncbi:kinase-like protein [Alternaria alternata]|nr:kinase-like protein [Alternaria alternata]
MFSLGCVLLEILSLHRRGSLDLLKEHREVDPAFHANISHLTTWLQTDRHDFSRREHYLECEIHLLLSRDPKHRPTAIELLRNIVAHDSYHSDGSTVSMFGHCCRRILIPQKLFKKTKDDAAKTTLQVEKLKDQLRINSINQAEREQRLKQWQKRYIWEQGRKEAETVEKKRMSEDHEMQLKAYDEAYRELELQKEEAITDLREAENTIHEGMKLHYRLEGQLHESQRACQMLEEELVALRTQFATISRDELQGRTSNVEDSNLYATMLKRRPDRHGDYTSDSSDRDRLIVQRPIIAGINFSQAPKDHICHELRSTPRHRMLHQSRCLSERRGSEKILDKSLSMVRQFFKAVGNQKPKAPARRARRRNVTFKQPS